MEKNKQQFLSIWTYLFLYQNLPFYLEYFHFIFIISSRRWIYLLFLFSFFFLLFKEVCVGGGRGEEGCVNCSAHKYTFLFKTWKTFHFILKSYMYYMIID
jgi:hypothetical protein